MRIRLNNCSTEEIKKYLDDLVDAYNVNISTINIYLNLNKSGKKCEVYDLRTLEPVFLNDKEMITIRDYICLNSNDLRIMKYIFECISDWTNSSKILMRSFLIYKFSNLSSDIIEIEDPSLSEVYDTLEEIYNKFINDVGQIVQLDSIDE